MSKACKESKKLTRLSSNTIYIGKDNGKYECAEGLCSRLGSQARPAQFFSEAMEIASSKDYKDKKVNIVMEPGQYDFTPPGVKGGIDIPIFNLPANVESVASSIPTGGVTLGSELARGEIILNNTPKFEINGIDMFGRIRADYDGNNEGKISIKNAIVRGRWRVTTKDESVLSMFVDGTEQLVPDEDVDPNSGIDNQYDSFDRSQFQYTVENGTRVSNGRAQTEVKDYAKSDSKTKNQQYFDKGFTLRTEDKSQFTHDGQNNTFKAADLSQSYNANYILGESKVRSKLSGENIDLVFLPEFDEAALTDYNLEGDTFSDFGSSNQTVSIMNGRLRNLIARDNAKLTYNNNNNNEILDPVADDTRKYTREYLFQNHVMEESSQMDATWNDCRLTAPNYKYKARLSGSSRQTFRKQGCRSNTAGGESEVFDEATSNSSSVNTVFECGPEGFHKKRTLTGKATRIESRTDCFTSLSNEIGLPIYYLELKQNSQFNSRAVNATNTFTLRSLPDTQEDKSVVFQHLHGDQSCHNRYSRGGACFLSADANSGGLRKQVSKDQTRSTVTKVNETIDAFLPNPSSVLYDHENRGNSNHSSNTSGNSHRLMGGKSITKQIMTDKAAISDLSRGKTVIHNPFGEQKPGELLTKDIQMSGESTRNRSTTGANVKSGGRIVSIITHDKAISDNLTSNSEFEGPLILEISALGQSKPRATQTLCQLRGDINHNGNVDATMNNSKHVGNLTANGGAEVSNPQGRLKLSNGENIGLVSVNNLQSLSTKSHSFSHESEGGEPILDINSTDVSALLTDFVGKGPIVRSKGKRERPHLLDFKTANFSTEAKEFAIVTEGHHEKVAVGGTRFTSNEILNHLGEDSLEFVYNNNNNLSTEDAGLVLGKINITQQATDIQKG